MSGRLRWMGALDMYRKVPADLMEGTNRGSVLSLFVLSVTFLLFALEFRDFMTPRDVTDLALDSFSETKVRLNFNISMLDLACEFLVVDTVSVLGTEQNISAHVSKWALDSEGIRQRFQGRNRQQRDIAMYDSSITETLDELLENGEHAVSLDAQTLEFALNEHALVFVDFYASWCSHCRDLAPTWEVLAELMTDIAESIVDSRKHDYTDEDYEHAKKLHMPVMIAKIDCVEHRDLCQRHMIMAYPTLRLFVDGAPWRGGSDYGGHRTVVEIADWLQSVENTYKEEVDKPDSIIHKIHEAALLRMESADSAEEKEWSDKLAKRKKRLHNSWDPEAHPGCQVSGHLLIDRVPGNFHIQARSPHHDLVPHMANLSHVVHTLQIGDSLSLSKIKRGHVKAPETVKQKLEPMNGNAYVTFSLHEAYHHYLKVITTKIDGPRKRTTSYQIIQSSQLSYYRNDMIPEAKFILDLSPIAVTYRKQAKTWYDFLTHLMAIIGGTFTVVGMLESSIHTVFSSRFSSRR